MQDFEKEKQNLNFCKSCRTFLYPFIILSGQLFYLVLFCALYAVSV